MAEEKWLTDSILAINGFLSPAECQKYISISEEFGFEPALLTSPDGNVRRTDIRNNDRVMFKNQEIADALWEIAEDFSPTSEDDRTAIGVNEMLRFYRYEVGQRFNWHQDFPFERDNGEASLYTLLIYLNDDFSGGETSFEDSYSDDSFDPFSVSPQQGMALIFEHSVHHKGESVTEGKKYVLRSDIMYRAIEQDVWGDRWEDDDEWGDDDESRDDYSSEDDDWD